jgi:hypothetical protein
MPGRGTWYNISDIDEGVYEKMYELRGSNALYATMVGQGRRAEARRAAVHHRK